MKSTLSKRLQLITMSISRTITIAPGLQQPVFNPSALKAGDMNQLHNWMYGEGSSVYVQWVPDELTWKGAMQFFEKYGTIDRVEFVPKVDSNRKQIGRMMFVHFEHMHDSNFAYAVTQAHPEPYCLPIDVYGKYKMKQYDLKCRVNCRPVAKVEYNTHQLTDMFERMNERITAELEALRKENTELFAMIDSLLQKEREKEPGEDTA